MYPLGSCTLSLVFIADLFLIGFELTASLFVASVSSMVTRMIAMILHLLYTPHTF